MIRAALQSGKGRYLLSALSAVAAGLTVFSAWGSFLKPLELLPKVAFVAAAFSVTAYNLRTRVIDLILKLQARPSRIDEIAGIARGCGKRLTNLVVLFTITALCLGFSGIIPDTSPLALGVASIVTALLAFSTTQFIYVLFAFERLENFVLEEHQSTARKVEADRLLK